MIFGGSTQAQEKVFYSSFRPIESTLEDCMKWFRIAMNDRIKFGSDEIEIGLERKKEAELIDKLNE